MTLGADVYKEEFEQFIPEIESVSETSFEDIAYSVDFTAEEFGEARALELTNARGLLYKISDRMKPDGYEPYTDDAIHNYHVDIGKYPTLTREEESELARLMEEGKEAKERIEVGDALNGDTFIEFFGAEARQTFLNCNLKLMVHQVKKRRPYLDNQSDVLAYYNDLYEHLETAVDKFDWRKGFKFSTYAMWWLKQGLDRAIIDNNLIRIPYEQDDHRRQQYSVDNEGEPDELAQYLEKISHPISMNRTVTHSDSTSSEFGFEDILVDPRFVPVEEQATDAIMYEEIREVMHRLDPNVQQAISLYYGLETGQRLSLQNTADTLGFSINSIKKMLDYGVAQLREYLTDIT